MLRTSALFMLVGLSATASGCHQTHRADTTPPTAVLVRAVQEASDSRGARYSGTIEPATRVDLAFKVGGYVRELLQVKDGNGELRKVQDGDAVSSGVVLAVVREGDYLEKVDAASARLAEAVANANQAKTDYDRTQRLVASHAVAPAEWDSVSSHLAAAQALVHGAEAQVRDAQLVLGDTALRAPMSGVVTKRAIEVGTFVAPGTPAFSLADTSSVKFVFGAPDTLVERLSVGSKLTIHVEALDADVEGSITRIAPTADLKSRTFEVETTIANPDNRLKPGFVASLGVAPAAEARSPVALPLTGVVRSATDPRGFAVFVVGHEGSKTIAHLRNVTLGAVVGNEVQVVSGLNKGDLIVSMGATLLVDGAAVRILPS